MPYQENEIEYIRQRIQEMFKISSELERTFPGRKFTLDGHLVGSIGEVLVSYYYGLSLLPSSAEKHDAIAPDGRMVQIKATQGLKNIAMRSEPEHLIVIWLDDNTGEAREVYNGPGSFVWEACGKLASNGTRPISISKLRQVASMVSFDQKLQPVNPLSTL